MLDVGQRLKWVREIVEPNQAECARIMSTEQSTWNKYEAGTRKQDPYKMVEFCNRFRVTLDYLYRGVLAGVHEDLSLQLAARHPELVLGPTDMAQDKGKPQSSRTPSKVAGLV